MDEARWFNPVLHGDQYCSPGCDGQCTKESYDLAGRAGEALVAHLADRGFPGWEVRVWEDGGWSWFVTSFHKRVSMFPTVSGGYRAYFDCSRGFPIHMSSEEFVDPVDAINDVLHKGMGGVKDLIEGGYADL